MNRAFDVLGLVVIASIISVLAAKPQLVTGFLSGFGGLIRSSQGTVAGGPGK